MLARAFREETGQGLTEYSLILLLVALAAVLALTFLGGKFPPVLSSIANAL
jgi:pilus assembly protein Flp/PilA